MNENNEEWDENGYDPTKEAFFSNLMEMEEEISAEGYQLVEHAISLINSQYYDDSIEILRQAIGLYEQINRQDEIDAINKKISEIYLLKEQQFRDVEIALDSIEPVSKNPEILEKELVENFIKDSEVEKIDTTDLGANLIKEAQQLIEIDEYDEALQKYDESFKIYEKLNDIPKLQEINELIEACYKKKTAFLKSAKKEEPVLDVLDDLSEKELIKEQELKTDKSEIDDDTQKRIKHLSGLAYKLLAQATERAENFQYDDAINLFDEANILFKQLSWDHEQREVQQKIQQLKQDKELHTKELEKVDIVEEQEGDTTTQHYERLDKEAKERFQELKDKAEKLLEIERQKEEDEIFQNEISTMVDDAEKRVRDYEYALRKDVSDTIKKMECPYSDVINIYTEIKDRLLEKGWSNEAKPYYLQINIYKDKLKKDENLRKVEAEKAQKQKDIEEMRKMDSIEEQLAAFEKKMEKIEELRKKETEKEDFEHAINEMINHANNLDREYTLALKKKNFIECPYPEIIETYKKIQKMLQEKGLKNEAAYYNNSIRLYKEKLEKDKKLREIEAKKARRDEEYEQTYMMKKEVQEPQIQRIDEQKKENQEMLNKAMSIIDDVEKIVKKYELSIRRNILEHESPYVEAVSKYREARKILQDIGWTEEASKLITTIKFYKEKKDKDDKLRAMEERRIREQEWYQERQLLNRKEREEKEAIKQKEISLKKEREEKLVIEKERERAYMLMDHAKRELILKNFDKAIELYEESKVIFQNINWNEGISMIDDSIKTIHVKKEKYKLKQKEIQEKEAREAKIVTELEEKISRIQEEEKIIDLQKKEKLLMKQKLKEEENKLSQEAYQLLEFGTRLLEEKKFNEAIDKYNAARDIFEKIGWNLEVSRINNDLLLNIKREQREYEKLLELRQKTEEAKRERVELIKQVQKVSKEPTKSKEFDVINKVIVENLEKVDQLIDGLKYNEAILILNESVKILIENGSQIDEINKLKHQIINLHHQSLVPIITMKNIDKYKNLKAFNIAYNALDNAHMSLSKNRFMKAISELNEAKFNLEELKFDEKYLKEIDIKINTYRERITGKRHVIPRSISERERLIKSEDKDLKERIEARRAERAKRVQDLLKDATKDKY